MPVPTLVPIPTDDRLTAYAELCVAVGLNLQPGQRLLIHASLEATPIVRAVTERAYRAGASLVEVLYDDPALTLARFEHAPEASFETVPLSRVDAFNAAAGRDTAVLYLRATDPDLLAGVDPARVATAQRAYAAALEPYQRARNAQRVNWCIAGVPTASWARKVFPGLDDDAAVAKLWDAILATMRADRPDPVAAWEEHLAQLERSLAYLNERPFAALRLRAPGTELSVGLPDGHRWLSARFERQGGVPYVANLPSEEVFTSPHAARTEGTVRASRPLAYNGTLIEGFGMRFEEGRVVEAWADQGEAVLQGILGADEGARRLGEIALVPAASPIAQSGVLFYNTLFDENAASHIALGRGFPFALEGAPEPEAALEAGVNHSVLHVDFMVGSSAMDVDGVSADGSVEAVMRGGSWAF